MSALEIQQIMGSRFRTSGEAEAMTRALMSNFGLTTKAGVARLAMGRSLAILTVANRQAIVVNAETYQDSWEALAPAFERIVNSFRLQP